MLTAKHPHGLPQKRQDRDLKKIINYHELCQVEFYWSLLFLACHSMY
jgi:hypothetical protein